MTIPEATSSTGVRLLTGLAAWAGAATALSSAGTVGKLPTRLLPLPILAGMGGLLGAYARNPRLAAYLDGLDPAALTVFHLWRIPAAAAFWHRGRRGELPPTFVRNAAWGDFIAGAAALPAIAMARRSGHPRAAYTAFHIFSLTDFVIAVGTGFAFSIRNDPRMGTLKHSPMSIIPLFGVPVTGALSLIALRQQLRADHSQPAPKTADARTGQARRSAAPAGMTADAA